MLRENTKQYIGLKCDFSYILWLNIHKSIWTAFEFISGQSLIASPYPNPYEVLGNFVAWKADLINSANQTHLSS